MKESLGIITGELINSQWKVIHVQKIMLQHVAATRISHMEESLDNTCKSGHMEDLSCVSGIPSPKIKSTKSIR